MRARRCSMLSPAFGTEPAEMATCGCRSPTDAFNRLRHKEDASRRRGGAPSLNMASCRDISRRRIDLEIGEMGQAVGLGPQPDLAGLRKGIVARFDHALPVKGDRERIAGNLQAQALPGA